MGLFKSLFGRGQAAWVLTCPLCGHIYRVGEDATIVTTEQGFQLAKATVIVTDGSVPVRTDLVASMEDWTPEALARGRKKAQETAKIIREAIAKGQKRYWTCHACDNEDRPFEYPLP